MRQATLSVVVAEADAGERRRLRDWLAAERFRVSESEDGMVAERPADGFQLALISAALPAHGDVAALRRLRTTLVAQSAAIGLVAEDGAEEQSERCLEAGMADVLLKPVDRADLLEAVNAWCEGVAAACPVDLPHLKRYTAGDAGLEQELWQLFFDTSQRQLRTLKPSVAADTWHMAVHSLKGSAWGMGCWRLGELAEKAEQGGHGDAATQRRQLQGLWSALRRVRAFVRGRLVLPDR